jgi:hypothetical protein
MTDLWQPNNAADEPFVQGARGEIATRTRRVRPITEAELERIMSRTKLPHPNDYLDGAPTAFAILVWGILPLSVAMILAALLA